MKICQAIAMSALESELAWRMSQWDKIQNSPNWPEVTAQEIRDLKLYSGAAGIYRDKSRTSTVAPDGVAVSILNSAGNYGDEIEGDTLIYEYPNTFRSASHDQGEITSLKNAMLTDIPIFVITEIPNGRRSIRLGWIANCEDSAGACLVNLDDPPETTFSPLEDLETEFVAKVNRIIKPSEIRRIERDPKFKFKAMALYKTTCAVTDVSVAKMLDAAHVIPVSESGPDDLRNSLLLTSSVHRAFDAQYWAIHPDSLAIATRENGPSLEQMKISRKSISHLSSRPHSEALEHRWKSFEKAAGGRILIAS